MKKILLHHTGYVNYRSLVKNLARNHSEQYDINIQPLHRNLFNIIHHYQPATIFLPVAEYTQEFHDCISEYHKNISFILLIDKEVPNFSLIEFWQNCGVKIIVNTKYAEHYTKHTKLEYKGLYDSDIFYDTNSERNSKTAVILSADHSTNTSILTPYLYPTCHDSVLVLLNNPEYKHPQNIGIFNNVDLSIVLNTFSYLIDMDQHFTLEAQACRIPLVEYNAHTNLNHQAVYTILPNSVANESLEDYSYKAFVANHLLSLL